MKNTETKLPKLPRGWSYDRQACMSDGSGGPWVEANSTTGDWVAVERDDNDILKWGGVSMYLSGSDDPHSPKDLARLRARIKTLRAVGAKLMAWARAENRRPHEPEYDGSGAPQ